MLIEAILLEPNTGILAHFFMFGTAKEEVTFGIQFYGWAIVWIDIQEIKCRD